MDPPPPISDEDDCSSGEDERSSNGGRRQRFCIERKQELLPTTNSRPKRPRIGSDKERLSMDNGFKRNIGRKRREFVGSGIVCGSGTGQKKRPKISPDFQIYGLIKPMIQHQQQQQQQQPKGPVIFINPDFVKKFIEKSIRLSLAISSSSYTTTSSTSSTTATTSTSTISSKINNSQHNGSLAKSISIPSIEDIDFKTSPKEALQAASTMAIIRLVTECIEDDSKREEKLNKVLVSRLIDNLLHKKGDLDEMESSPSKSLNNNVIPDDYNSEISQKDIECGEEDTKECEVDNFGGRPIPVIGGSVNQHFNNKSMANNHYSKSKQCHNPYQRPKRHVGVRINARGLESTRNKLKNSL